ncbi:uncharacterized protein V6R79_021442 [Siganus canaliculatus]
MCQTMMGFVHAALVVLCFLSGAHSVPVTKCENLTRPIQIQGREQLLGKWIHIAESTNLVGSKLLTKAFVDSSWMKFSAGKESDDLDAIQVQKMFGSCFTVTSKVTVVNSTLYTAQPMITTEVLLNTSCTDCIVVYTVGDSVLKGVQLLSRRTHVTAAELEEFKKQVQCLNLPSPAILNPDKGLCPEQSLSQDTEVTDLTGVMENMGSEHLSLLDSLFNSDFNGEN